MYDHPIYGDLAQLDPNAEPRMTYLRGTKAPLIIVEHFLTIGMQPHDICEIPYLEAKGCEELVEAVGDILFYREQDAA